MQTGKLLRKGSDIDHDKTFRQLYGFTQGSITAFILDTALYMVRAGGAFYPDDELPHHPFAP